MRNVKNLTLCVLLLTLVSTTAIAATHYVSPGGSIQAAIDAAGDGDEIEVATGTYLEAINFKGKAIKLYSSGGPDVTTIDGSGKGYHVVQCVSDEGSGTILEGFTITGGNADGTSYPDNAGGGMFNDNSSPSVTNCNFSGNSAGAGGGMHNTPSSSPNVTNCTFSGNSATWGGGMDNAPGSSPNVTNCTFSGNSTDIDGGGMFNYSSSPTVTNCTFSGNLANFSGGGINNMESNPTVTNCKFSDNSADQGGGVCNRDGSSPTVTNCTFTGNDASYGGGMFNRDGSNATVTNCIFWADMPDEIFVHNSTPIVTYSDVQGGWTGMGNIDLDPMFADVDGRLSPDSPCIDAGNDAAVPPDITTDLDGNPRIQGACVDMGAFEAKADPETMLVQLRAYILQQVALGNIDAEMETSLLSKVEAAIAALNRDNPNDAKVAMNDLKALVNQVEAQTDKKITPETAAEIIQRANDIIAELGG